MDNELTMYSTENHSMVIYHSEDDVVQLEVQLSNETVWLTQQQMALLFGTQRQAITKHIKNIYESGELNKNPTSSILEQVQKEVQLVQ